MEYRPNANKNLARDAGAALGGLWIVVLMSERTRGHLEQLDDHVVEVLFFDLFLSLHRLGEHA